MMMIMMMMMMMSIVISIITIIITLVSLLLFLRSGHDRLWDFPPSSWCCCLQFAGFELGILDYCS